MVTLAVLVGLSNYLFGAPPVGALGTILLISLHLLWGHRQPLSPAALTHTGRRALQAYGVLLGGVLLTASILKLLHAPEDWRNLASPALWVFAAAGWFSEGVPSKEPLARA